MRLLLTAIALLGIFSARAWGQDAGADTSKRLADQPSQVNGSEITPDQQRAVARGLDYLASRQAADGSYGGGGGYGATAAITSLAGLAFMADGNLPGRGKYGDIVRKAEEFVLHNQQESGLFTAS